MVFFPGCKCLNATLGVLGFTDLPRQFRGDSGVKHFSILEDECLSLKVGPCLIPYIALATTVGFI